ncbi:MAG TPA: hypothetical protein K8W24_07090, partial [Brachybacterium paraconglomeratum]|nr:hypothetical protein [Brachybacterium paraconglomeratum]
FHAPQQDYTKRLLAAIPGGSIPLAGSETIDVEAPEGLAYETGGEGDGGPDDIIDPFTQAGHV